MSDEQKKDPMMQEDPVVPEPSAAKEPAEASSGQTPEQNEKKAEDKPEEACPSIFDKPVTEHKVQKKHRISRQARNVILSLVLIAALGAGIFGIYRFLPKSEDTSSSTAETQYMMDYYSYFSSANDTDALTLGGVTSVAVHNGTAYDFVMTPTKVISTQTNSLTYEQETVEKLAWNVESAGSTDIGGVSFSSTTCGFLVGDLLRIPYASIYAESRSAEIPQGGKTYAEECGIDSDAKRLTISFADGSQVDVVIGIATPTNDGYYVALDARPSSDESRLGRPQQDDRIYIAKNDTVAYFLKDLSAYVNNQMFDAIQEQTSSETEGTSSSSDPYFESGVLSYFDSLSVSGGSLSSPLVFSVCDVQTPPNTTTYYMTSPTKRNVSLKAMDVLIKPLSEGFEASSCIIMLPTAEELKNYGFSDNPLTVNYVIRGQAYRITVGKQVEDGYYAVMVNGKASIYKIASSAVGFVSMKADDYGETTLYKAAITDISEVTVNIGGKTTVFTLHHGTQTSSDGEDATTLWIGVSSGGQAVVDDFRTFFKDILLVTSEQFAYDGTDASTPVLSMTFRYVNSSNTDVLRFSPYSARRYYATLNGTDGRLVQSNKIDSLITEINALVAGAEKE